MPFVKVRTNVDLDAYNRIEFLKKLSKQVAADLGKPESYVMAEFKGGQDLIFGGTEDPAAHVVLESIGLSREQCPALSYSLCEFLDAELDIPSARVYISFGDLDRAMFGWDKQTFA